MTRHIDVDSSALKTIFHECQQCGICCEKYRKITLHTDEVDFIKKMGGHVGVDLSLAEILAKGLTRAREEALASGKVFMIRPDDKGCLFLQKRDGKYYCKIYNYRPRTCRGFKSNLADGTFLDLFGQDSINLLGQNSFGLPLS
jgi:Fe-S-cluster containining protein